MPTTTELHVLRVFVDDAGDHGNPLGVFVAGAEVPPARRQAGAAELGFSETVFVDDPATGALRIHTPTVELPLAGHPLVGTAWLLATLGPPVTELRPPAGPVEVAVDDHGRTWITADPTAAPPWALHELASPAEVVALAGDPTGTGHTCAWAWEDRAAGRVRMRVFAAAFGIAEDPATGSAALRLCAHLGLALTITQGAGSVLLAEPAGDGRVRVGGRCVLDDRRPFTVR